MKFLEKYYPVILAALSVAYSNYLWFSGKQLDGLYVGLWPWSDPKGPFLLLQTFSYLPKTTSKQLHNGLLLCLLSCL